MTDRVAPPATGTAVWNVPSPLEVPLLDVPVALLHGEADRLVPIRHTHQLAERRREAGLPVQVHTYPGARHGFLQFPSHPAFDLAYADLVAFLNES